MRHFGVFILLIISFIPLTLAQVIEIIPDKTIPVIIAESGEPATFSLEIINNGQSDEFEIFSLAGVTLEPTAKIPISAGASATLEVKAYPNKNIREKTRGFFIFQYEVYSSLNGKVKREQLTRIVDLGEVFEISVQSLEPDTQSLIMTVRNLENRAFSNVEVRAHSLLFEDSKIVSLDPYKMTNVSLAIDNAKTRKLVAGNYDVQYTISFEGLTAQKDSTVKYLEQGSLSVEEGRSGAIVRNKIITKTNEGNVPVTAIVTERRDIITRLVTKISPQPTQVTKSGFFVIYTWEKQLAPSESLVVTTSTNYTLPLLVLLIVLLGVSSVYFFTRRPLSLSKRVSMVKTKGGEFALKITLHVRANALLSDVIITDRIPHTMKLHENYGSKPHAFNESARQISWNIAHLNTGETRVLSYIIYSKVRVVGSFSLPLAQATFVKDKTKYNVFSNKTSSASESLAD